MRILVVGAGAIGGYFGGRLLDAGADVTFLVRPRRATELADAGLVIKMPDRTITRMNPPTVLADQLQLIEPFDLVLLSCKAYDLDDAMASFAPAVGPATTILPMLNGMVHLDRLDEKFGRTRVIGGYCVIAATLNASREIVQLQPAQSISFGERDGTMSDRIRAIAEVLDKGRFGASASQTIVQEMWEKWVFLASVAASTCLMRGPIGNILKAPGGRDFLLGMLDECTSVARTAGFAPRPAAHQRSLSVFTQEDSPTTASMFRDIQAGARVEADHVIGDLIRRGEGEHLTRLRTAHIHLKAYEASLHRP